MRSAFALRINSGRIILNFGFQESLRTFLKPIFTGGGREGKRHLQRRFLRKRGAAGKFWSNRKVYGSARSPSGELSRSD